MNKNDALKPGQSNKTRFMLLAEVESWPFSRNACMSNMTSGALKCVFIHIVPTLNNAEYCDKAILDFIENQVFQNTAEKRKRHTTSFIL